MIAQVPQLTLASKRLVNAFTVDVEDYYQVSGFESSIDRGAWESFESRVVGNTDRLLNLLEAKQVRGTFYVLGWVADKHPELVRRIHELGHEVASHSYWHRLVYSLSPDEFRDDLRRSRDTLQQIIGAPVTAYRAPSFSITARSLWALEILVEEGFKTDSSIFPVHHDRYGIPNAVRGPHQLQTPAGSLWEFPPSVSRLAGFNLPVGGGGYFRLFPLGLSLYGLSRVQQSENTPIMFYIHPWEVDPDQPRLKAGTAMGRFRHYVNLARTESKLGKLLGRFTFGTISESLASHCDYSKA